MAQQQETTWYLRLKELVSAPLKKLNDLAGYSQRKLASVANATSTMAKQTGIAGTAIQKTNGSLEQMQNQLRSLERLQAKSFDPRHVQNYERAIRKVKEDIASWNKMKELPELQPKGWFGKLKGGLSTAIQNDPILGQVFGLVKNPAMLAAAGVTMAINLGATSIQKSEQFEYGMAKINATAQLPIATLDKLKGRLLDIGSHSGGNFDQITDAYEKILSTTGKVNMSLDITETAIKGAKAGFADIDLVAGALAQTLASVGNQNATANEVLDTLLKAKAVGAGEFKDFAQYLPGLIASAKNLGLSYKDTAALFSFMTFKGQSAADSAMLMQNAFTALQKKDIIVGLKKKGIDLFEKDGSRRNIETVFTLLSQKMAKFTDKQKTKFLLDIGLNDAQARQAFAVLTSDANEFKRVMGEVNDAIGETEKQLAATNNQMRTWGDIGDQWSRIGVDFGDGLKPLVESVSDLSEWLAESVRDWLGIRSLIESIKNPGGPIDDQINNKRKQDAMALAFKDYKTYFGQDAKKGDPSPLNPAVKLKSDVKADKLMSEWFKGDDGRVGKNNYWFQMRVKYWEDLLKVKGANEIDPSEDKFKKARPLDKLNKVDNTTFSDKKGRDGEDGNRGLKTLIQNLYITNHVQTKEDLDKFRRKFTDDIVDAGRDGLVTLGD